MDRSEKFYREYIKNSSTGRLRDIIMHDCADSTEQIADTLGIKTTYQLSALPVHHLQML